MGFDITTIDWKSVIRTVAPALATALGTPLAGVATKVITDALLGESAPTEITEDVLAGAVRNATPDQLIELKKASIQFESDMARLGVDIAKIEAGDRADARHREIATGDQWTPRVLAGFVTLGFFGILFWILNNGVPETGGDALLVMLGSLGTAWIGCMTYYYGTTAGSATKTDMIARAGTLRAERYG